MPDPMTEPTPTPEPTTPEPPPSLELPPSLPTTPEPPQSPPEKAVDAFEGIKEALKGPKADDNSKSLKTWFTPVPEVRTSKSQP